MIATIHFQSLHHGFNLTTDFARRLRDLMRVPTYI
jgi:hypothetical protein